MRPKVFHNIEESHYTYQTENIIYYFSSMFYRENFIKRKNKNREDLKYRLSSRYCIDFNGNDYFDIILYKSIEKRGFKIEFKNGGVVTCQKNIILDGVIKMLKS